MTDTKIIYQMLKGAGLNALQELMVIAYSEGDLEWVKKAIARYQEANAASLKGE